MNIILIGMPASGKSTVGVILAKLLGFDFIDTDLLIQRREQQRLSGIIATRGLSSFLAAEEAACLSLQTSHSVIATGGSAIYSDGAMRHFSEIGTIVYLEISYESLVERLGDLQERGVVMRNGTGMSLRELFAERKPLYEKFAEITVDIDDLNITDAARKVANAIR